MNKEATELQLALEHEKTQAGEIIEAQHRDNDKDVAAQFLARLDLGIAAEPVTETEARRLLWKIDLIIIPLIMVTVVLAAIDKVIISNAAIYRTKTDTHLTGDQYSWVGSIFYFGYLAFEYPAALLIQRLPVAKLYAGMVIGWAILLLCTAATQNFAGLVTVRFLMGMTEAAVFPISSILTVMWCKTSEQPIRVAFWFNQLSSVFSGVVSYGIGQTDTALAPWSLLFIVLGVFSLVWLLFYTSSYPIRRCNAGTSQTVRSLSVSSVSRTTTLAWKTRLSNGTKCVNVCWILRPGFWRYSRWLRTSPMVALSHSPLSSCQVWDIRD